MALCTFLFKKKPGDVDINIKMKKLEESHELEGVIKEEAMIWDCESALYDSSELVAMNHIIEKHFRVFPYSHTTGSRNLNAHSSRFTPSSTSIESDYATQEVIGEPSKAKKHRVTRFLSELLEGNIWEKKNDGEMIKERAKGKKSGVSKIFGCGMSSLKK